MPAVSTCSSISARVERAGISGLNEGQKIAYVFAFGDEWRVSLELAEIREGGEVGILERKGDSSPQYPELEE